MLPSEISHTISGFLTRTLLVNLKQDDKGPDCDTDLFESGLIDSFGFTELVSFLESTFGVKFTDEDLVSPETATLAGLTRIIASRVSQSS